MLVVPALVGVEYQPFPFTPFGIGLVEHVHDHLQVWMVRYCVADDFPVVHVEYWRQVALVRSDVYLRHVGSPLPVGSLRVEVTFEPVRCGLADLALIGTIFAFPPHILQAKFPHEPVHRLTVDLDAFIPQLGGYAAIAVAALVQGMQSFDPLAFLRVAVRLLMQVVEKGGTSHALEGQEILKSKFQP